MVKAKDMQFCMDNLKWKEKGQNNFWPSKAGIRTPDFQIIPAQELNFHGR